MTALKIRGPFRGASGYDHVVREFVRGLDRQGVAVQLIDFPEWGASKLPTDLQDPWFETLSRPVGAEVMLQFCMPHQLVPPERGQFNVNYTMFEANRIPHRWVERSREADLVILPTESSRRAWVESGVPDGRIRVCPLGVNPELFAGPVQSLPLRDRSDEPLSRFRVRFLNVSELGPRKNLPGVVRAWLRATTPDDDAVLIMKLGVLSPGWQQLFDYELEQLQRRVGKRLAEAARIHFVREFFSDREMPRLFASATHYISLSRGEGWDQPMLEAAASGLRLIAPNHSAYTAYLDPSVARLLTSYRVPAIYDAHRATQELFRGAFWWEPDEGEAIDAIRAAIDGRDAPPAAARERILTGFTWEQATRRLIAILSEAAAPRWGRS